MQITVYRNFAKELNSTKQPTGGEVVNCVLKLPTTRLNPIFILESTDTTITHIKWDNRYYFVDDYNHTSNSVTEYICSVDPMGSWKSNIGASSQYVLRSASDSNEYIIDNLYPTTTNMGRTAFPFTGLIDSSTSGCYVLGLISGNINASNNAVTYYCVSGNMLGTILSGMYSENLFDDINLSTFDPAKYIASCTYYPFDVIESGGIETVQFGYWTAETSGGVEIQANVLNASNRIKTLQGQCTIEEHPGVATRGKYLNASPYRKITLSMYSFGQVPVDGMYLMRDQTIYCNILVDMFTGSGTLIVYTNTGYELTRMTTSFGVPIQLAQIANGTSALTRAIGTVAHNMLSGSDIPLYSKLGSMGDAYAHKEQTLSSIGSNGSLTELTLSAAALVDFMDITADDNVRMVDHFVNIELLVHYRDIFNAQILILKFLEAERKEMLLHHT